MVLDFEEIELKSVIGSGAFATVFRGIFRHKVGRPGEGGDKKMVRLKNTHIYTGFFEKGLFTLGFGGRDRTGRGAMADLESKTFFTCTFRKMKSFFEDKIMTELAFDFYIGFSM